MNITIRNKITGREFTGKVMEWNAPDPGNDPLRNYGTLTIDMGNPEDFCVTVGLLNWEIV